MKAKFRKTKDDIFGKLAEANIKKDYVALAEHCDELVNFEDESITDDVKKVIYEIKAACLEKDEDKIHQGFQELVKLEGGEVTPSDETRIYTTKVSNALKKGDMATARALSKEFSEKTKDALEALGKKPLDDDYLLRLMDANNKGKTSLVRKMLKGIPH